VQLQSALDSPWEQAAREAGGPQHSDTLDSLLHGSEPEWAHPLHGGYPRQPDCFLVSASYCGDVSEGFLHLEWASSCLQEVAVDAVEVTPGHRPELQGREGQANGKGRGGGRVEIATRAPARARCSLARL